MFTTLTEEHTLWLGIAALIALVWISSMVVGLFERPDPPEPTGEYDEQLARISATLSDIYNVLHEWNEHDLPTISASVEAIDERGRA